MKFYPVTPELEPKDSPNFTEEEAAQAIETESLGQLSKRVTDFLGANPHMVVAGHELLYRGEDVFWRANFTSDVGESSIVFLANWLVT